MMKRLCIYITYDPENIVDKYIGYMLQELHKVVAHLVVVCNYESIVRGMDHICPYADQIFYRENTGFDAGAYKDALCQYIGWKTVCGYDELLLVNDSFYGPFYTLGNLFEQMEKTGADYWGMTRCPETELADGFTYQSHIQSYFFAFGKKVLQCMGFRDFWENMAYPASFMQAIIQYEIGINKFLHEAGFVGTAVMDLGSVRWNLRKNENPHMLYPLELIRDAGVPFLKRKSLILANRGFADAMGALKFIQNECGYDVSLIEEHLRRTGGDISIMGLDQFYAGHSRVFIYGAGFYGRQIAAYFEYKGWCFESFLVTNKEERSENCIPFDEADITANDGIVIAVGHKKMFLEIFRLVKTRCDKGQIFNQDIIV